MAYEQHSGSVLFFLLFLFKLPTLARMMQTNKKKMGKIESVNFNELFTVKSFIYLIYKHFGLTWHFTSFCPCKEFHCTRNMRHRHYSVHLICQIVSSETNFLYNKLAINFWYEQLTKGLKCFVKCFWKNVRFHPKRMPPLLTKRTNMWAVTFESGKSLFFSLL